MVNCACQDRSSSRGNALESLRKIRLSCTALREFVLPDVIWDRYCTFCNSEPDRARHISVPLLALREGYLSAFTFPIHSLLLEGIQANTCISAHYKNAFRENWVLEATARERYERSRQFLSRWFELRIAQWCSENGLPIKNLEAYGGPFDIEISCAQKHLTAAVEVKYLALSQHSYSSSVVATRNGCAVGSAPIYTPLDALLCRIADAAYQLREARVRRIAAILLSEYDFNFRIPLTDGTPWFNWSKPQLFTSEQSGREFAGAERLKDRLIDDKISQISSLDEIWIFAEGSELAIRRMHVITPKSGNITNG